MGTSIIWSYLLVAALGQGTQPAAGAPRDPAEGLVPGDRFSVRIEYSNKWSLEAMAGKPRARSPGASALSRARGSAAKSEGAPAGVTVPPERANTGASARPASAGPKNAGAGSTPAPSSQGNPSGVFSTGGFTAGRDPLSIDLKLLGEVKGEGRMVLALDVARVHYWNSRGAEWTIAPKKEGELTRAENMALALVADWKTLTFGSMEFEMVEEQLLGLAIAILDGEKLEAEFGSSEAPIRCRDFDAIDGPLDRKLGGVFPTATFHLMTTFLNDAASRILGPKPEGPIRGSRFERRGIPYSLAGAIRPGGRPAMKVFGKTYQASTGVGVKDWVTFDVATGLVFERDYHNFRDSRRGNTVRFGLARWRVTGTGLEARSGSR